MKHNKLCNYKCRTVVAQFIVLCSLMILLANSVEHASLLVSDGDLANHLSNKLEACSTIKYPI